MGSDCATITLKLITILQSERTVFLLYMACISLITKQFCCLCELCVRTDGLFSNLYAQLEFDHQFMQVLVKMNLT